VTCPLWVASTRVRLQKENDPKKYNGLWDAICKIYETEGLGSLWNGSTASLVLVSNPTIQFVTYDKLKTFWSVKEKSNLGLVKMKKLTNFEVFLLGAISKTVATFATYPIQVAQSILRAQEGGSSARSHNINNGSLSEVRYKNTLDCLVQLFKKDGIFGWFRGLDIKLLHTVLTAAFHFMAYEHIARIIFKLMRLKSK